MTGRPLAALWLVAAVAASTAVQAAPTDGLTPGQLAIDGYWRRARPTGPPGPPPAPVPGVPQGPGGMPSIILTAALPHLQPWARAFRDKYLAAEAAGQQMRTPGNLCLASHLPGTGVAGGPSYLMAVLVEPRQASFLFQENRQIRFARIGGEHPRDLAPSWLGDSVAHWEGDTLVVDTVGFNDANLMGDSVPVTRALHVVQRLRVVDGRLEDTATFEDPGAFTGPFTAVHVFERAEPFQEYICAENNNEGGIPTATGVPTPYALPGQTAAAGGLSAR